MAEKIVRVHVFFNPSQNGPTAYKLVNMPMEKFNSLRADKQSLAEHWEASDKQDWHGTNGVVHVQLTRGGQTTILYGDRKNPSKVVLEPNSYAVWFDEIGNQGVGGHKAEHGPNGWQTEHFYLTEPIDVAVHDIPSR